MRTWTPPNPTCFAGERLTTLLLLNDRRVPVKLSRGRGSFDVLVEPRQEADIDAFPEPFAGQMRIHGGAFVMRDWLKTREDAAHNCSICGAACPADVTAHPSCVGFDAWIARGGTKD